VKSKTLAYWVITALLALELLVGSALDLTRSPDAVGIMTHLRYPIYVLTILGVWKLLGAIAVLAPGYPRLKEWAYAGIIFDMTGAVASHIVCGDGVGGFFAPALIAVFAVVSWALRPPDRALRVLELGRASHA
jgi:hypothetical protein